MIIIYAIVSVICLSIIINSIIKIIKKRGRIQYSIFEYIIIISSIALFVLLITINKNLILTIPLVIMPGYMGSILLKMIHLKGIRNLNIFDKIVFLPCILAFLILSVTVISLLISLLLPHNYQLNVGEIPSNIKKILFINRKNYDDPRYCKTINAEYKINRSRIQFIEDPTNGVRVNRNYIPRLFHDNNNIHYLYHEANQTCDLLYKGDQFVLYKKYKNIKLTKNKFEHVEVTNYQDPNNPSTIIYTGPSILFQDDNYHLLEYYYYNYDVFRHVIKSGDNIYLYFKKNIYKIDKEYIWKKIYSCSQGHSYFVNATGLQNMQIFDDKLFIIENVFYPGIITQFFDESIGCVLFPKITVMIILDIKTEKIIKKYYLPKDQYDAGVEDNSKKVTLWISNMGEYPFRVLNDDRIIVSGKYIIDLPKREIEYLKYDIPDNPIFNRGDSWGYECSAVDFIIIPQE